MDRSKSGWCVVTKQGKNIVVRARQVQEFICNGFDILYVSQSQKDCENYITVPEIETIRTVAPSYVLIVCRQHSWCNLCNDDDVLYKDIAQIVQDCDFTRDYEESLYKVAFYIVQHSSMTCNDYNICEVMQVISQCIHVSFSIKNN